MKQHPNDIMQRIGPTVLFNMTGKFGKAAALATMSKAAGSFLLALRAMGGEAPDDPEYHQIWGQTCGLPGAKAFDLLKNVMITCGWIVRADTSNGFLLKMTGKGQEKAVSFAETLDPDPEAKDGETPENEG